MSSHCCDPEPDQPNKKPKVLKKNALNIAVLDGNHTDVYDHTRHEHEPGEDNHEEEEAHSEDDGHDHGSEGGNPYLYPAISLILLLAGIALKYYDVSWFTEPVQLVVFGIAYLLVAWGVLKIAFKKVMLGNFFNEFSLMSIATLGAFAINEYEEGVAVMLFYTVGELFNESAVNKAKGSIKALLDIRPDTVTVMRNGVASTVAPKTVKIGEIIQVKPGEKVALDGDLLSQESSFNTAALTGESKPDTKRKGEKVLAGMINLTTLAELSVTNTYENSALAKILDLVQNALSRKSQSERFITKFAKVYTPIVFFAAVALVFIPYFIVDNYDFRDWLYRGLVFLVISCPCALVVSIPLGYFGGIGAASRNGILFKGANFLDIMTTVDTVVVDKTGTMTKGVFKVQKVQVEGIEEKLFLQLVSALESKSTHPIAIAVTQFNKDNTGNVTVESVEEIAGHGLRGKANGYDVMAGNAKLLKKFSIAYPAELDSIIDTIVVVAINGKYSGYIMIADEIKEDAVQAVQSLRAAGVRTIVMLSGDKDTVVQDVAKKVGIDEAYGGLLPEDKVFQVEKLKSAGKIVAFLGDGVNDAPVVALADVGMAVGGLGSDATIETADVVIQTDQPSKIATAIHIGKATKRVVWQNIFLAFGVKAIVLALGAWGVASLWEAVFADVGVALLAIMNAIRIQKMTFS